MGVLISLNFSNFSNFYIPIELEALFIVISLTPQ